MAKSLSELEKDWEFLQRKADYLEAYDHYIEAQRRHKLFTEKCFVGEDQDYYLSPQGVEFQHQMLDDLPSLLESDEEVERHLYCEFLTRAALDAFLDDLHHGKVALDAPAIEGVVLYGISQAVRVARMKATLAAEPLFPFIRITERFTHPLNPKMSFEALRKFLEENGRTEEFVESFRARVVFKNPYGLLEPPYYLARIDLRADDTRIVEEIRDVLALAREATSIVPLFRKGRPRKFDASTERRIMEERDAGASYADITRQLEPALQEEPQSSFKDHPTYKGVRAVDKKHRP
jgi:hypothetical protein